MSTLLIGISTLVLAFVTALSIASHAEANPWQTHALQNIGEVSSGSTPSMSVQSAIERNKQITRAYASIYLQNPMKFKWAGMAALASDMIGHRISQTDSIFQVSSNLLALISSMKDLSPELEAQINNLQVSLLVLNYSLARGNFEVYKDLYWQHIAFQTCGVDVLSGLSYKGPMLWQAWNDIASGDPDRIWKGNTALLEHEQKETLQHKVYDLEPKLWKKTSDLAMSFPFLLLSPVGDENISFTDKVPSGNVGKFEDRWLWITQGMIPAAIKLDTTGTLVARVQAVLSEYESIPRHTSTLPSDCTPVVFPLSGDAVPPAAPTNLSVQ